jgi:ENTS family enterobactin (siderophore) exporter
VYDLTGSNFAVGLVGFFGLVPLVVLGLYGGSVVDAHDRRKVALAASVVMWLVALVTAAQAWLDVGSVALLYVLVAVQAAGFAVNNPARQAIVPALLRPELLPAANALTTLSFTLGFAGGPLLAGLIVGHFGYEAAYTIDAMTYLAALWAVWRLPPMPPHGERRKAGLRSVLEGLRFLGTRPNVRMTFLVDLSAMVFAQPRALFPAVGALVLGGGPFTAGLLLTAVAAGSVLAGLLSGPLGTVRRQGLAVLVCVVGWGLAIAGFGLVLAVAASGSASGMSWLVWPAVACLALAGAADAVSAVFRTTILQVATPDAMRGRLQGVFIVVVAGGPRLGDLVAGAGGDVLGEAATAIVGGMACALAVVLLARWQRSFARYDAYDAQP